MSCTATSNYLTLLTYYYNESNFNIQDQFTDILKSYNEPNLKFGNHSSQPCIISQNRYPCSTERHQKDSHDTPNFNCLQI